MLGQAGGGHRLPGSQPGRRPPPPPPGSVTSPEKRAGPPVAGSEQGGHRSGPGLAVWDGQGQGWAMTPCEEPSPPSRCLAAQASPWIRAAEAQSEQLQVAAVWRREPQLLPRGTRPEPAKCCLQQDFPRLQPAPGSPGPSQTRELPRGRQAAWLGDDTLGWELSPGKGGPPPASPTHPPPSAPGRPGWPGSPRCALAARPQAPVEGGQRKTTRPRSRRRSWRDAGRGARWGAAAWGAGGMAGPSSRYMEGAFSEQFPPQGKQGAGGMGVLAVAGWGDARVRLGAGCPASPGCSGTPGGCGRGRGHGPLSYQVPLPWGAGRVGGAPCRDPPSTHRHQPPALPQFTPRLACAPWPFSWGSRFSAGLGAPLRAAPLRAGLSRRPARLHSCPRPFIHAEQVAGATAASPGAPPARGGGQSPASPGPERAPSLGVPRACGRVHALGAHACALCTGTFLVCRAALCTGTFVASPWVLMHVHGRVCCMRTC